MANRECRKCQNIIPYWTVVDGKRKSLQNRKFCIQCSPYLCHNTKRDITSLSRGGKKYREWSTEQKQQHIAYMQTRSIALKQKAVNYLGGKCSQCGYSKTLDALHFHHLDPKEKSFELSKNMLRCKAWEVIVTELNKCILLCANCHAEVHSKRLVH